MISGEATNQKYFEYFKLMENSLEQNLTYQYNRYFKIQFCLPIIRIYHLFIYKYYLIIHVKHLMILLLIVMEDFLNSNKQLTFNDGIDEFLFILFICQDIKIMQKKAITTKKQCDISSIDLNIYSMHGRYQIVTIYM
jgi:hypothetical protein